MGKALKPIKEKMVFTYLFDRLFKGYRSGDLEKIDVINYSFGVIEDGKVNLDRLSNIERVIGDAHDAGVRVVLSIGGWGAGNFSEAAATPQARKVFIESIVEAVKEHDFDGVDMDWEYPTTGVAGISSDPKDRENFTFLMKELHEALKAIDEELLVTAAVPAGNATKYYEVDKLNAYLDYLHIMTYDMSNMKKSTHHTNLFPSQFSEASVKEAVNDYVTAGFDKEKVIVGIAFYGHIFTKTSGIGKPAESKKSITYTKILDEYLNNDEYEIGYDEDAKARYIFGNDTFISYEDAESIANKCKFVLDENLGGVMVWEYCQDDDKSTLVNAIFENIV